MIPLIRHHLIVKVALIVLFAVALGFGASTFLSTRAQVESFEQFHQVSAASLAQSIGASVKHTMLAGNGLKVRHLVDTVKSEVHHATIRIYAPSGEEVFGEKPPPPEEVAPHVQKALTNPGALRSDDGLHTVPIPNQTRCRRCHESGEVRGVLSLSTQDARTSVAKKDVLEQTLTRITQEGFEQIMTSNNVSELDDYFEEMVAKTPGLTSITILDSQGDPFFGNDDVEPPADVKKRALTPGDSFGVTWKTHELRLVPLENAPRCQGCHEPDEPMRGALMVGFDPQALKGETSLLQATQASLEHVMLRGLGRLIKRFLDQVAATGTVTALTLHDEAGRLYHDALEVPEAPAVVQQALKEEKVVVASDVTDDGRTEFVYVEPMRNEKKCQSCHGTDRPLRGVIEVRLDTTAAVRARSALVDTSILLGGTTVALVVFLLYLGLRSTVVQPVQRIGQVADRVGDGDFDAAVDVTSLDEIGRLGVQINTMISGLRKKLALSKFVSQETVRTVDAADGAVDLGGARRRLTILFSDIRGFTAYSDVRDPEEVVAMLNRYLQVQTDVVIQHGGDIDKYVGDELMACFDGPNMEARAVRCGVDIVAAVDKLNVENPGTSIHVGVGVNVGDAVLGAMGSQERMDYTAIGDTVNLAARMCSAAKPGEVLITEAVRTAAQSPAGVRLEAKEPIRVKGKPDPIAIYAATGSSAS